MAFGHLRVGSRGEHLAERELKRCGYKIVERNFRCAVGEVDLVAWDGEVLVFVEVKTRTRADFTTPQEAVDWKKRRKLAQACEHYLLKRGLKDVRCRFDVLAVLLPEGRGKAEVAIIRDAFRLEG
ncbi:MAG: YraN family protein [Nitrospinota bacterium]